MSSQAQDLNLNLGGGLTLLGVGVQASPLAIPSPTVGALAIDAVEASFLEQFSMWSTLELVLPTNPYPLYFFVQAGFICIELCSHCSLVL